MPIQYINTGTSANKGNGDTLRLAFTKVNENFSLLANPITFAKDTVGEVISNPAWQNGIRVTYNTTTQYASFLLNIASSGYLGGVKIGAGLTINRSTGVLSGFSGNYNNLTNIPQPLGTTASPTFANVNFNSHTLTIDSQGNLLIDTHPLLANIKIVGSNITSVDSARPLELISYGTSTRTSIIMYPDYPAILIGGDLFSETPNTYSLGANSYTWRGIWVGTDGIQFDDGSSLTSATGLSGAQGPQGPIGNTGTQGPQGPIGPQGIQGSTGTQGPIGNTGTQGIQGPVGDTGAQGISLTLIGSTDTVNVSTVGVGQPGQGWIGTNTGHVYFWNTLTTLWEDIGPIVGPAGPRGPQGVVGAKGDQGIQGPAGPQGSTGTQGIQGPEGPQGPIGNTGTQGIRGVAGPVGLPGQAGVGVIAGGTAGQILTKIDDTNYNTQWADPAPVNQLTSGTSVIRFDINGVLTFPGNSYGQFQILPAQNTYVIATNPTVIFTGTNGSLVETMKATIQVQADGVESPAGVFTYHSQICEMLVVRQRVYDANVDATAYTVSAMVYGVTYTSANPLATFDARWNSIAGRVEITMARDMTYTGVTARVIATESVNLAP